MAPSTEREAHPDASRSSATPPSPGWDDLPICVAIVDASGRIVAANAELCARTGTTRVELELRSLASIVGDAAAASLLGASEIPASGIGCPVAHKGGGRVGMIAHRRAHGAPGHRIITLTDDGGAHAALPDAEAQLRSMLDSLRRSRGLAARERATRRAIESALDHGDVVAFEHDLASGVVRWYGTYGRVIGLEPARTREELVGLVHPDDVPTVAREVERALRDGDRFELGIRLRSSDHPARRVAIAGAFVLDGDGHPLALTGVCRDATALHDEIERLRSVCRRVNAILESITDGFVALDRASRFTYVNHRAARIVGREPADLLGKHVWTELRDAAARPVRDACERVLADGIPTALEVHDEASDRWIDVRVYPSEEGVTVFATDVTERKRREQELRAAHDQLRALSARLARVREEESTRIAREIHDDLGQVLTAIGMDLASLRGRIASLPTALDRGTGLADAVARLDEMRSLVRDAVVSVQRISSELRPALLDAEGLSSAMRWYAADVARRSGIRVTFEDDTAGAEQLRDVETALFRIFQEALTNVVRHSRAERVDVRLAFGDGRLVLTIHDDGVGLDSSAISDPRALGLLGMRERAAAVGGLVSFERPTSGGTRITASVPVPPVADPRRAHSTSLIES